MVYNRIKWAVGGVFEDAEDHKVARSQESREKIKDVLGKLGIKRTPLVCIYFCVGVGVLKPEKKR